MRFACRLAIDSDRALGYQVHAIRTRTHDASAPEPLVEALPVPVFNVSYRAPPLRNAASAANGPPDSSNGAGATGTTGRRRRNGINIAGAGGPCWSPVRPAAGRTRKPSPRNTAGTISG